jgi:hypothetical protein
MIGSFKFGEVCMDIKVMTGKAAIRINTSQIEFLRKEWLANSQKYSLRRAKVD